MKKQTKNIVFIYLPLLLLALVTRFIGNQFDLIKLNNTGTHIADSLVILVVAFTIMGILKQFVQNSKLRRVTYNIVLIGTLLTIFFTFRDQLFAIGISLGIVAAVLTFIFQTTILSVVGWVYILTGNVYSIGDRIRIGNLKGDVVSITPLRTKILEIGGEYIASDVKSGRIYTFPNSILLTEPLSNYTKELPYIWVDLPFHLTYETDFEFLLKESEAIVIDYIKSELPNFTKNFKKINSTYSRHKQLLPYSFNTTPSNSWIEFRITIPVDPFRQSDLTTALTLTIIQLMKKYPRKIQFPKGRVR